MKEIDAEEAKLIFESDKSCLFVDVRSPEEWVDFHIDGMLNIPINSLLGRINEIKNYSSIYFICASGGRSGVACQLASAMGIKNCWNILGGIEEWKK